MADIRILRATDEAEARGDASGALDLIQHDLRLRQDDHFWRPERVTRLLQLSTLGPLLPAWATSRWVLAQAAQWVDESNRDRMGGAFAAAFRVGGFDPSRYRDELDLRTKILDHNWVFRQAFLFDLGGLRHFLDDVASPDLVEGADHIGDWVQSRMGAYQYVEGTPQRLTWLDLAEGSEADTANIGSATLLEPGDFCIGRLQPLREGRMFESAPLRVPERVARRIAVDPADWVATLAAARFDSGDGDECVSTNGHDFPLLTDVPGIVQQMVVMEVQRTVCGRDLDDTSPDEDLVGLGLVRAAVEGRLGEEVLDISPWPVVAATILRPSVYLRLANSPEGADARDWRRLGSRVAGPAASLCRGLADLVEAAA